MTQGMGPGVDLHLTALFQSSEHADALKALCGELFDHPAYQLNGRVQEMNQQNQRGGGGCVGVLTQHDLGEEGLGDGQIRFPNDGRFLSSSLQLDRQRCRAQQECRISMRTFLLDNNNNKEEVMYPAIVDVFLVKADNNKNNSGNDGDANGGIVGGANAGSSGFSTSFAAVLSSFAFSSTHGAGGAFAGLGAIYHALSYAQRARFAVVLGSGGGFAPAAVRQGQRDAGIAASARCVLVDGNMGHYGQPDYLQEGSRFRQLFSDVEVVVARTDEAIPLVFSSEPQPPSSSSSSSSSTTTSVRGRQPMIDLLIVDADHSLEGVSVNE